MPLTTTFIRAGFVFFLFVIDNQKWDTSQFMLLCYIAVSLEAGLEPLYSEAVLLSLVSSDFFL